ncbi:MAG TPA: class I SAM-dependent methyltransferase [Geothrix sp.]|jgi:2-polyprenyl-3-methyl-5-hydroxy-6-metoxy-1,4-benzoquinol methylase
MTTTIYSAKNHGYYANNRDDMLAFIPAGVRRILEIGCGSGEFGAAIKRRGEVEIVGVELVESAAAIARQRLDQVITADIQFQDLDLPGQSFDCLVCNDVLEHLVDPWSALARLRHFIKPDGWLVTSIPNVRHHKVVRRLLWPGEWRYEDEGILDRTHLRFFTRASARALVEGAGFEITHEEGIHRSGFPFWLRAINAVTGGMFDDMRYLQFVMVARPVDLPEKQA